jgi:hypothetical protein
LFSGSVTVPYSAPIAEVFLGDVGKIIILLAPLREIFPSRLKLPSSEIVGSGAIFPDALFEQLVEKLDDFVVGHDDLSELRG